jgi:hypothetical protein
MMPLKNIKEKRLKSLSLQIVMEEQMTTRRVAACIDNVEIVDLLVDGDNDMVQSIDTVLAQIANEDAVPISLLRFQQELKCQIL